MTDDAHHMRTLALLIQGVAHGLAVDGQTLIPCAIAFVPALQSAIQIGGRDADWHIAEDGLAGHHIMALFATASEALPRFLPEALGPIRNSLVPAHPAESGPAGDPQHRGQTMSSPLGPARIGHVRKETRMRAHVHGSEPS